MLSSERSIPQCLKFPFRCLSKDIGHTSSYVFEVVRFLLQVVLYPYSYEKHPTKYRISVPQRGIIADVFKALSEVTGYNKNQFVAAEVVNAHFQKIYASHDSIESTPPKV